MAFTDLFTPCCGHERLSARYPLVDLLANPLFGLLANPLFGLLANPLFGLFVVRSLGLLVVLLNAE